MGKELSEELPVKSENWKRDAQVLENYLKNRDETSFLTYVEDIQGEIPPCLAENLLTISAQHDLQKAVKAILDRFKKKHGLGTNSYLSVREPARMAVQKGHHVILEELLNVEPNISHHLILSVCLKLGEPRKRGVNDTLLRSNLETCLELILINVDVCCIDIADISSVLSAYFDDCLKKIRNQTHENVIEFDYRCLMSPNIFSKQNTTHRGTCETEVFLIDIARNKNLNHLLKHPLLSSFLYRKWFKIRCILYTYIVFYGIFYVLLNTYILLGESLLWIIVIAVLWLLFTIWEILLFACCPRRYFMNWRNWPQVVLLIFTLILLCGVGLWCGVIVFILSALVMLNLIGQHLKYAISFEMFRMFLFNYVRLLFPYMFLIVAFALAFYKLFENKRHFSNFWDSLFKTLIMVFTGEFNSNDIPVDSYPVLSGIVLMLFAIFIFVLVNNVIPAVCNTEKIRSEAELNGLISHIHLIIYLENIAFGEPFSWFSRFSRGNSCLLRWKPFSFLRDRIFLFSHYLENGKIIFAHADVIYSNSVNYNKLSPSLDIIKKAERIISDKNQLLDNKEIRIALNKQQEKLTVIEDDLKNIFGFINNFVNLINDRNTLSTVESDLCA